MKVSREKTVLLASTATGRTALRQAAGEDVWRMVALEVKDLGVDTTMGPLRRIITQSKNVNTVASTARRMAQVPNGWEGRLTLCTSLLTSAIQWVSNIIGISVKSIAIIRHWTMFAITGGDSARRAPEAVFALVSPNSWLDPDTHLTNTIVEGWLNKAAQKQNSENTSRTPGIRRCPTRLRLVARGAPLLY
eukprot:16433550-Heterocapsa_arctica.AAC.4